MSQALEVFSGHVQLGGNPRVDPEFTGQSICVIWPGNSLGTPPKDDLESSSQKSDVWNTLLSLLPELPDEHQKDGWMIWSVSELGFLRAHIILEVYSRKKLIAD